MTTQDKVLRMRSQAAQKAGLELVVNYRLANQGHAMVQRENDLTPLLTIAFEFQPSWASLDVVPPDKIGKVHGVPRSYEMTLLPKRVEQLCAGIVALRSEEVSEVVAA